MVLTDRLRKVVGERVHCARSSGARGETGWGPVIMSDWIMDAVDDLVGRFDQDIVVETSIDPALQGAAERALAEALCKKARSSASAKAHWSP